MSQDETLYPIESIAVIGMSGRFPGAENVREFWRNLRDGVESISRFTEEELLAYGIGQELLKSANYVRARGVLQNIELFDADFFGVSPREAEVMDPQFRFFLENAWEALEDAGYDPQAYEGVCGIFGGMSLGQYFLHHLLPNREVVAAAGPLQLRILNDKDFLTTLTAYKLNLKGPTVNVQTACSTSLVAVHLACQSLLSYQCDMALAGGVSILVPQKSGYRPQEGVFSPDGHCRAFDADAEGTVSGNAVGAVVLKRLSEALQDGDHIRAVIKGTAINNDGASKVSYTAPSVDGQAEAIAMAQAVAQVGPETITYVEAHGTGTPMGDPIEVAALTQVFRAVTEKKGFCALGSVKTNIGHADAAAGVASLIKTVLAMEHKALPPSLNFNRPNPEIDFDNSPFYVNAKLREWKTDGFPRRAGISSFAVGGTNAHLVVEEAPATEPSEPSRAWQLILLSAKTAAALETIGDNLAAFLKQNPGLNLADVAYTLRVGRRAFDHRRTVVCRDVDELATALETRDPKRVLTGERSDARPPVAFMFPGLGNHYVNMGRELYQLEPSFRADVDRCCELLREHLGSDLRDVIYPEWRRASVSQPSDAAGSGAVGPRLDLRKMLRGAGQDDEHARRLNQTLFSQPALFVIEYGLAQLWMRWGVTPRVLLGYSIGEYVAACLAGVWSLEDALMLVAKRAQLIEQLPGGAMLAISLPWPEVKPLLNENLSLAAVNGPGVCVVAGESQAIADLESALTRRGVVARRLQTAHAFHSSMMEPIVNSFTRLIERTKLRPPSIPLISDVTGTWMTAAEATDPRYWATHLCRPVLFGDGIKELWQEPNRLLLEVGPGQALGAWARQHPESQRAQEGVILSSLRHSYDRQSDQAFLLTTLGRLWLAGCPIDWNQFHAEERRRRVSLPSYPFERKRYWVEAAKRTAAQEEGARPKPLTKRPDVADWLYLPAWKQTPPLPAFDPAEEALRQRSYLVFDDECGVGLSLIGRLRQAGRTVLRVVPGERFVKLDVDIFQINPERPGDYDALLRELEALRKLPDVICHLWSVTPPGGPEEERGSCDCELSAGFYSLLFLAQALGNRNLARPLRLLAVSNGLHSVSGEEALSPAKAALLGPCKVIPQEYPQLSCRSVDVIVAQAGTWAADRLTEQLLSELAADASEPLIAYRGNHRWLQTFEGGHSTATAGQKSLLREGGVYLITGGMGGIGLTLADYIARQARGRLILTGRAAFPKPGEWEDWLSKYDGRDEVSRQITKLRALQAAGAEVLVARGDVTSREQMRRVIAEAHEQFGKIDGVIHAAGVAPGGMIQVKSVEAAAGVLAPKVKGTLLLDELLKDEGLDFFILCSSLSAITGAFGLVDHCAANAFLDAFAEANALRPTHYTLSVNWDAWLEVGQAARDSLSARLQGLLEDAPRPESKHPLWERLLVDEPGTEIRSTTLGTDRQWILDEHRLLGHGVVPGTGYLEMVRAAVADRARGKTITLRKVTFLAPLMVKEGEAREARLILKKRQDEAYDFRIVSKSGAPGDGEGQWQEHVRGKVSLSDDEPLKRRPLAELLERLKPQLLADFLENAAEEHGVEMSGRAAEGGFKNFGPRWQNLVKSLNITDGEGIARVELPPEFAEDLQAFKLHPSIMDAATGFGQIAGDGLYLPQAYESVRINAPLPQKLYSYIRYKGDGLKSKEALVYDLTIMDEEGRELVEIQEYTLRKITNPADFGSASRDTSAAEISPLESAHGEPPSNASVVEEGILPVEGAEVFGLILRGNARVPRIAVSTRELMTLIERSGAAKGPRILEEVNRRQAQRQKHARPNLQVPYLSADSEMERRLTAMWQETLRIDQIGIHDNFFDMGGDSLIATLLIERLGEAFQVNVPLAALINAPTVAEMSTVIAQLQSQQATGDAQAGLPGAD
jgi:acyl transferase domain-containing protein